MSQKYLNGLELILGAQNSIEPFFVVFDLDTGNSLCRVSYICQ